MLMCRKITLDEKVQSEIRTKKLDYYDAYVIKLETSQKQITTT